MAKGVIVVDIPECCDLCQFLSQAYDLEPFEDGEGYCSIKMESLDQIQEGEKPEWCPIKPMPERAYHKDYCDGGRYDKGWNECLDKIEGE